MSTIHEERARASLQAGLAVIPATLLYTEATLLPIASVFLSCSLPPPSPPSPPSSTSTPHHHPPAAASSSIWKKPSGQEYLRPTISIPEIITAACQEVTRQSRTECLLLCESSSHITFLFAAVREACMFCFVLWNINLRVETAFPSWTNESRG